MKKSSSQRGPKIVRYCFTILALLWTLVSIIVILPIALLLLPLLWVSKTHYLEWILFFTAIILALGIYPIGFCYQVFKWKKFISYLRQINLSIDISGNIVASSLFNDNFILSTSQHPFGKVYETVSDNLGENERDKTLSPLGQRFTNFLSVIDINHAQKSIVEDPKF